MNHKNVLTVDFGASSGRAVLGSFDGNRISIRETHRFSNDPVILNGTIYWGFLRLFFEVKQGLMKAKRYGKVDSIGVDTQGVDFGLTDKEGHLLGNPAYYRDAWTVGILKESFGKADKGRLCQITGSQLMEINTVFQLLTLLEKRLGLLERASRLLLIPGLFDYHPYGTQVSKYSIASTTQMLDVRTKMWLKEILESLGIPERFLSSVIPRGMRLGFIKTGIYQELGIEPMEVTTMAKHDTQSAPAVVPIRDKDFVFINCGTWSLLGTELDESTISGLSERLNITNEGGCQGKTSFPKNITGLWLIQESRRQWIREGKECSFGRLEQMAVDAEPFKTLIDPDASEFVPAGNIPERIRRYCHENGQRVSEDETEIIRCIDESLTFKYRVILEETKMCTGREYPTIHMVDGGIQSELLRQMTTNARHCPVVAGPVEATVLGNAVVQLFATRELRDPDQVRSVAGTSTKVGIYKLKDTDQREQVYGQHKKAPE